MAKHTPFGVDENFWARPRESSRRKQQIVSEYFVSYNNVMVRGARTKVGYADLFAGPGIYDDQSKSTPILITEATVTNDLFRQKIHLWFNEGDPDNADKLERALEAVPGISTLKYPPTVTRYVVNKAFAPRMAKLQVPTLVFADPCGYKGLSLALITSALQPFGCDVIFFFNYNRVNMKLSYPVMDESINEFFERERAQKLRGEINLLTAAKREQRVLDAIKSALLDAGAIPVVFAFRTREGGGTSHHLVFGSKNQKGAGIMKRVMTKSSSKIVDGVGSWDYVSVRESPEAAGPRAVELWVAENQA